MNPATKRTSDSADNSVNIETKKKKKHKRKEKKNKKKKRRHQASDSEPENHKKSKYKKRKRSKEREVTKRDNLVENEEMPGPSVPADFLAEASKSRTPMTKEEWEKSQNVIRRVYDETGRSRLIKGDGEVLEEIVSKEKHREINRQATLGDGLYFQSKLQSAKK